MVTIILVILKNFINNNTLKKNHRHHEKFKEETVKQKTNEVSVNKKIKTK